MAGPGSLLGISMNYARLESRVCLDEGFRAEPYLDTVNVPTIGYGTTKILGRPVQLTDGPIEEPTARQLLRQDLFAACMDAQSVVPNFDRMNDVRQEVLANMAYNIGKSRLSGFSKMLTAAQALDYEGMAAEMKDSKWYGQVGQRGLRLYFAMKAGEWA
jgi:lysozyme